MSRRPIALSPDLLRLRNEGYDLDIRGGYLLIRDIPYVDAKETVKRGILISKVDLAGEVTTKPSDHVAYWTGEHPCHSDGRKITEIQNPSGPQNFGADIRADFTFSAKADYRDYYHKMTTYIGRISGEAAKLDPTVTAKTFPAIPDGEAASIFRYVDTATSRAGIGAVNAKLAAQRVGIVGLGGSGAYILDLAAKTMVAEIHLFDGDVFSQHNAFRAPGAATLSQLQGRPKKVHYFQAIYTAMRNGILAHPAFIDESNVAMLDGLDFVFICIDAGDAKRIIIDRLIANQTPFVEVGMGVVLSNEQLGGIVRVTTSTHKTRDDAAPHISYVDAGGQADEYSSNIQIAELNALHAVMAVMQWKKFFGVYRDARNEFYGGYSIASGEIVSKGKK